MISLEIMQRLYFDDVGAQKKIVSVEMGSTPTYLGPPFFTVLTIVSYAGPWSLVVSAYGADGKRAH